MIILYAICAILWTMGFAFTEGYETLERSAKGKEAIRLNSLWHTTQIVQRLFGLLTGFFFCLSFSGLTVLVQSAIFSNLIVFHWILSDGVQNLIKGKRFFYQSKTSTAITESYAGFGVKLILFTISIVLVIVL